MKQTILVTGSAGFIGKVVVQALLKDGYKVVAMLRPGTIPPFIPNDNLTLLYADILKYDTLAGKVKKVDAIVHLAANKYHPRLSYDVNLKGAENIIRLIEEKKVRGKRLINISSQSTKIRFRGVYGESKRLSDQILEREEIEWTTLKPSLVYGADKGTLFQTIKGYVQTLPFVPMIGNGKWELYPIDVEDLANVIIKCLELKPSIHKVYDLGDAKKVTFDELVYLIEKELGIEKRIFHLPAIIGLPAVYVATKLIPSLPISVDNVLGSTQNTGCEPKKAAKELKIDVLPLKMGLKKYVAEKEKTGKAIIVVGLGKMGILHAGVLNVLPGIYISAIVDKDQSLGTTAQSMGIAAPFFQSLEEAIRKVSADAVYICTPTFAHQEVIELCEKNNLPYFVEKPVFPQFNAWSAIKTDSHNMAGYFWIYKREVVYTKEILAKGVIGEIKKYNVSLKHSEVFGPKKGWMFVKKLSGGGVLANPGPHALSLVRFLFGKGRINNSQMKYLYGNEVEDAVKLTINHQGLMGILSASWSVKGYPVMTIEFRIEGSKGYIEYKNGTLTIKSGKKKQVLSYKQIPFNRQVFNLNPKSGGDAYYAEDQEFAMSLSGKSKFVNNMIFARDIETMINEAYEKAE